MIKRKAILNSWYKFREEFDLKNFIFLDAENDWINCLVLVLINKRNMIDVLQKHVYLFKEELGDDFTPESLNRRIEKKAKFYGSSLTTFGGIKTLSNYL